MDITIIALISIICILIYLNKNLVVNAPITLYKKFIKYINEKEKKDKKIELESNINNKNINVNLQDLDIDFPILFSNVEKKTFEQEQQELLKKKRALEKVLKIKDSVYELEKELLLKNKKLTEFVEHTSERVYDAALDAEQQKIMAEKAVIWIKDAVSKQKELELAALNLKKDISEKNIRLAQIELERQKDNVKLQQDRKEKIEKLSLNVTEQEIAKQTAIDASKKASAEAVIAEAHKETAKKSAAAAEGYRIKTKKEAEAIVAKAILDKVKNKLINDKSDITDLIQKEREEKMKLLNEANYEKQILNDMKNKLEYSNNRVFEIEEKIRQKQGDEFVRKYNEKIKEELNNKNTWKDAIALYNFVDNDYNKSNNKLNDLTGLTGKLELIGDNIKLNKNGLELSATSGITLAKSNVIDSKTTLSGNISLVAWVTVNNLDVRGGAPFAINQDNSTVLQKFDAIDFGEKTKAQWMHGSDYLNRTCDNNNVPILTTTGKRQCIIITQSQGTSSHKGPFISNTYINGVLKNTCSLPRGNRKYGSEEIVTYDKGTWFAVIGPRLYRANSNFQAGHFVGTVHLSALFNKTLTQTEINKIYNNDPFNTSILYPTIPTLNKEQTGGIKSENDILIDELYNKLKFAMNDKRIALRNWNNRKKILFDKMKKYKSNYDKQKVLLNMNKKELEANLTRQLEAEKEYLKTISELDDAERQEEILRRESEDAIVNAEKRVAILRLKDKLKSLNANARIMEEEQIKMLEQQAETLKLLQAKEKEKIAQINLSRLKKEKELIDVNNDIKQLGAVNNVSIYPISTGEKQYYSELYDKYPILRNNYILVFQTIDTALNVLNNFTTVEIGGVIGTVDWIKKNDDNTDLDYCISVQYMKDNLIKNPSSKYVCPASAKRKDACFSCDELALKEGIIILKNVNPKINKPIIKTTLNKIDLGITSELIKNTPLELDNNTISELSLLNLDCGESVLSQFRLVRGLENRYEHRLNQKQKKDMNFDEKANQIAYNYTCNKLKEDDANLLLEEYNRKTQLTNFGDGSTKFLNKQKVNCQLGLISGFNLKKNDKNSINYDYNCLRVPTKNCTNHTTMFDTEGYNINKDYGHVKYLNRHNVTCPTGKFLKEFYLDNDQSTNEIRYKYRCCQLAKKGEISTGDIPNDYKSEKIIFNGTSNEQHYLFNGRNNYFTIPKDSNSFDFNDSSFTIEFNFKLKINKFSFILSQGFLTPKIQECCTFFGIGIRSSTIGLNKSINNRIYFSLGFKTWEGILDLNINTNYHFAITYDSTKTIRMYINGLPMKFIFYNDFRSLRSESKPVIQYTWREQIKSTGNIYIGKLFNKIKHNNHFNGSLSQLRIWNIDRTEQQIKETINKMIFHKNLILYLPLNNKQHLMYIHNSIYSGQSQLSQLYQEKDEKHKVLYKFALDEYEDLTKLESINEIQVYPNYKISFNLRVLEKLPNNWTNILRVSSTKNDCCERFDRNPGLWFHPNKTSLHLVTGSYDLNANNYNLNINTPELLLDNEYKIEFSREKSIVKLNIYDITNKKEFFNIQKNHTKITDKIMKGTLSISQDFNLGNIKPKAIIKNLIYYHLLTEEELEHQKKYKSYPGYTKNLSLLNKPITPCDYEDFKKNKLNSKQGYYYDPLENNTGLCRTINFDNLNKIENDYKNNFWIDFKRASTYIPRSEYIPQTGGYEETNLGNCSYGNAKYNSDYYKISNTISKKNLIQKAGISKNNIGYTDMSIEQSSKCRKKNQ